MQKQNTAHLVLQDGTTFRGLGFGAEGCVSGEVVFNTAMSGYQEILTDPSYQGQIVTMTYPHIGNTGINPLDVESRKIFATALIVKECSRVSSNYRANISLNEYLQMSGVCGLEGIDTRALVRHIRSQGAMPALVACGDYDERDLKLKASDLPSMNGQNLARVVSCEKPYSFSEGLQDYILTQPQLHKKHNKTFKVVAYDYGVKTNILRLMVEAGIDVHVVPYTYPAESILQDDSIDGVFLSNGPGDPSSCHEAIETVKKILGKKPIFGICLGHQILALALGAKTYKLKFGHRGGNQPVLDLKTKKVEITSQNHGFAVDEASLPQTVNVTHINLNDRTIEGLEHKEWPAFSVQYHPEASPGPHDSQYLFDRFVSMMNKK